MFIVLLFGFRLIQFQFGFDDDNEDDDEYVGFVFDARNCLCPNQGRGRCLVRSFVQRTVTHTTCSLKCLNEPGVLQSSRDRTSMILEAW